MANEVVFNTTILQEGNNTGIQVPEDAVEKLAAGKRPPVKVTLNGFTYRSTIAVMGGRFLIPLSAERRTKANVKGGDQLDITLALDTEPREVELPNDFKAALNKNKKALTFFEGLSYSAKLRYVLPITQAKTEETRQLRIEKAITDLVAGKK
ncbi:YdeI/OmpD-associated family protein [Parapedobacter tibetensis]|uniref:YdeI/OmpD-associated family protein n=1 Tax=Parapedobacter tibetensis TaxID=2972951 RepID=UPI00214D4C99|nr:YdeI/OmpD-associated family protein [Parapedobacter tibetensis]